MEHVAGSSSYPISDELPYLRQSEQRYQALLQAAAQLIWIANASGHVEEDLPAWRAHTGQSAEEIRGQGWLNAIHPEDRDHILRFWTLPVAAQTFYEAEQRIRRADGEYHTFLVRAAPVRDDTGAIREWVGFCTDVTERKQQEVERLRLSHSLRSLLESTGEGIYAIDLAGRCTFVNRSAAATLGYQPEELHGQNMHQMIHHHRADGSPYPEADCPAHRAFQEGQGVRVDNEVFWRRDGTAFPVAYSSYPLRDDGDLKGAAVAFTDITERKRLEQRTQQTLNALLAMAETLVDIPETSAIGARAAPDEIGPVARRLGELTRSILGCRGVGIVSLEPTTAAFAPIMVVGLTPEQEKQWWASIRQSGLKTYLDPVDIERLRAGQELILNLGQLPFGSPPASGLYRVLIVPMLAGSQLVGALGVEFNDPGEHRYTPEEIALAHAIARLIALVIERDRLLREREAAHASELALREANRRMDEFLGIASHELKTPLTSLIMSIQMAERRVQAFAPLASAGGQERRLEAIDQMLARAAHQTRLLSQLVSDLLDVSRIQAGRLELRRETTDLRLIISDAVEQERQVAPQRVISLQLPDQPVSIFADPIRIGEVVTNYLTNALKYSAESRPVAVGLDVQDQQARVWVRDQGPGLPAGAREHLWERFYRVPGIKVQSGSGVGLGLGLSISRAIIERHGGQVGVESAPGQGSTFWCTLPLAD